VLVGIVHLSFEQIAAGWTQQDTIVFLLNILIAVGLLVDAIWAISMSEVAKSWPVTQGRIISSRVSQYEDPHMESGQAYKANIRYEYNIGINWYQGTRVRFEGGVSNLITVILNCVSVRGETASSSTRESAKQLVQTHQVNKSICVSYAPHNHRKSVLTAQLNKFPTTATVSAIMALSAALFMLFTSQTSGW